MSDEDYIATTDEDGVSVEYVPISEVRAAFIKGLVFGEFVMGIAAIVIVWIV
jgi:hypothetical protein